MHADFIYFFSCSSLKENWNQRQEASCDSIVKAIGHWAPCPQGWAGVQRNQMPEKQGETELEDHRHFAEGHAAKNQHGKFHHNLGIAEEVIDSGASCGFTSRSQANRMCWGCTIRCTLHFSQPLFPRLWNDGIGMHGWDPGKGWRRRRRVGLCRQGELAVI